MTRRLHIGGKVRVEGWEVLNANAADYVDHVCNARDLSQFASGTFDAVYASHVVEHFDYKKELVAALTEWNRVTVPGGRIYVSVPDLDTLCRLFLDRARLSSNERFRVMMMIFGGHVDQYDYHLVGLNDEFLASFLRTAGYVNLRRVAGFGLFDDTSNLQVLGEPISLNVVAHKAAPGAPDADIGQKQPCPCGSGKKFKACHGHG